MTPEQLAALQAQIQNKQVEADGFLATKSLAKAEKAYDERDALQKQYDDAVAEAESYNRLVTRKSAGHQWSNQAAGGVPHAGKAETGDQGKFTVKGFEEAGHSTFRRDPETQQLRLVNEAGAGTFGREKWELFKSIQYKSDFVDYLRNGRRQIDLCTKTLMEGVDESVGVFVPADFVNEVVGRKPAPTSLRGLVRTYTTGRDSVQMPRKQYNADDKYTNAFRATWLGEKVNNPDVHKINDSGVLGLIDVPVRTAFLSADASKAAIEDAAFPILSWLESELNESIDLLYEEMIVSGNGVTQPTGIITSLATSYGATDAERPEVILSDVDDGTSYKHLNRIQMALPPQYENENTRWVMNKRSGLSACYEILDGNNRPILHEGAQDYGIAGARVRRMLGDPVVLSSFMPNVGAGAYPFLYGDLRGYLLAQRLGFSIQVLNETKAKQGLVELVGRLRFGGKLIEPWRVKVGKSDNS